MGTEKQIDLPDDQIGGWAVSVLTFRIGGGEPVMALYGACLPDRDDARRAICAWLGRLEWDGVGDHFPLSKAAIAALNVEHGATWSFSGEVLVPPRPY